MPKRNIKSRFHNLSDYGLQGRLNRARGPQWDHPAFCLTIVSHQKKRKKDEKTD